MLGREGWISGWWQEKGILPTQRAQKYARLKDTEGVLVLRPFLIKIKIYQR